MPARLSFFKFYVLSQLPVGCRQEKRRDFFTEIFCMSGNCCTFASANGDSIERMGFRVCEGGFAERTRSCPEGAGARDGRPIGGGGDKERSERRGGSENDMIMRK